METIDALADAINEFEGGLMLVSHDFRLIGQVAEEIWVCENVSSFYCLSLSVPLLIFLCSCFQGTITKWESGIQGYKEFLKKRVLAANKKAEKAIY